MPRATPSRGWYAAGLIAAAVLLAPCGPAAAAAPTIPSARPKTAQAAPAERHPVVVKGFRSAHFGMTETEVRRAISTDFHLSGKAIHQSENPVQRTHLLGITVPNVLPNGGKARIEYVFGFKSHTLIEVELTWSAATDPTLKPPTLVRNGQLLQSYFLGEGFAPHRFAANVMLANGSMLMLRGRDAAGHAVVLTLAGTVNRNDKARPRTITLDPTTLSLDYIANPTHPDVFRLRKGTF
ncbi:MAG: hypothetical protein ACREFZ_08870 [Acetobacteraceae bacterium]